jgi:serine protease AprX
MLKKFIFFIFVILLLSSVSAIELKANPNIADVSNIVVVTDNIKSNVSLHSESDIIIKQFSDLGENVKLFQTISMPSIFADYAWSLDVNGLGLNLGIADTGFDNSSDATSGRLTVGRNFCTDGNPSDYSYCGHTHGCRVASIAGGNADDLNGVAIDVNFVVARIFNSSGSWCAGSDYNVFFSWVAENGASIVNNSWGTPFKDSDSSCAVNTSSGWTDILEAMDLYSLQNSLLMINSAGNDGTCDGNSLGFQAMSYNVLTVGALNDNDTTSRADDEWVYFSSVGPTRDGRKKPDIIAPGTLIQSYTTGSTKSIWNGTSASTPHVAGAAILLQELGLTNLEIKSVLINSADDISTSSWDKYTGWGYLNIKNALDQNAFVDTNVVDVSTNTIDSNKQTIYLYPSYSNFYDLNDVNAKCSVVWNREFDESGDPYLQNYDLYIKTDYATDTSTSSVDNVEQVYLSDTNESFVKVYCSGDSCSADVNYALACNIDSNKLDLDYFLQAYDSNFYTTSQDGNFTLLFDLNKLTSEQKDLNFDVNILFTFLDTDGNTILQETQTYTDIGKDYNIELDLNYDYANLSDYNLQIDINIFTNDFNQNFTVLNSIPFDDNWDSATTTLETDSNTVYYLMDGNYSTDFNFFDTNIFMSYSLLSGTGVSDENYFFTLADSNSIRFSYDLNKVYDYNAFGSYELYVYGKDVFGKTVDKNIQIYYKPVFTDVNYYINTSADILYYRENANDINISYIFEPNKDYNIYLINLDNSDINFLDINSSDTIYFYDLNLENDINYRLVLYDANRDENILDVNIVSDSAPSDTSISVSSYNFILNFTDADINSSALVVQLDNSDLDYSLSSFGSDNNITGILSSSVGSHTLTAYLIDNADNNTLYTYSYTVSAPVVDSVPASTGGGGSSGGGGPSGAAEIEEATLPKDLELSEVKELEDIGKLDIVQKDRSIELEIEFENSEKIDLAVARIFVGNKEIFEPVINGKITLPKSYAGKEVLILVYKNGEILFKGEVTLPVFVVIKDTNNSVEIDPIFEPKLHVEIDLNETEVVSPSGESSNKSIYIFLWVIILLIIIGMIIFMLVVYGRSNFRKR